MSRNFILVFGAICWAGVSVDAIVRLISGDPTVAIGSAVAFVVWATLFRLHFAKAPVGAEVRVEA
jgi:hypothetical protein